VSEEGPHYVGKFFLEPGSRLLALSLAKWQRGEPRLAAALFLSDSSSPSREVEIIAVFASKRFWSQSDISTTKA
jgi:hypothetical protein